MESTRMHDATCPLCGSPWSVCSLKYWLYGHFCRKLGLNGSMLYWNRSEFATEPKHLELKQRREDGRSS